jgi:hypothetical protein
MWKIFGALAASGLLALLVPVRADDAAKPSEVVARAIKAHGGLDNLKKLKASFDKSKGKVHVLGQVADFTSESSLQLPDRLRTEIQSKFGDQDFTFIQVVSGGKGWNKIGDSTTEMDKDMLAEAKEQLNAHSITHLACLVDKEYKLSPLGEVKVGDRPAIGVRVERKGYRDVSLFFDKEKSLLLKMETRTKDIMQGQEYTSTALYDDYKKVEEIMVAHKVKIERDGNPFVEAEITEAKVSEKLDDSVFEKP